MRLSVLLLLATCARGATLGPIPLRPALAVYVVVGEGPCTARVVVRQTGTEPERLMARIFGPTERASFWRYLEYVPQAEIPAALPAGLELRALEQPPKPGDLLLDETIPLSGAGVHQLRLLGGARASSAEITLPDGVAYGVSCQNGDFAPVSPQLASAYAYVPPHAERLTLVGGPVTLSDEQGRALGATARGERRDYPVSRTDVVWRLDFPKPSDWQLRATGFPLILCPTPEAARAIRASVEVLPDGTTVCHRVQARIAAALPDLLAPARVGQAEQLIVPLATRREAWLADPLRNLKLKDGYLPMVEQWLARQNVDPSSHWSGSMDGWQGMVARPAPANRWDRYRAEPPLYAGASNHYGQAAAHLALAATWDDPTNPYFGREALLYRAAAASLRDLMVYGEDEVFPGLNDLDPYPGNTAFALGQKTLPVFALAGPRMPPEIRALWADALRPLIERTLPDYLVSARNQSSHYLVAFQCYALGTGDPRDEALARIFARRWVRGQHPSGFHQEATGPCASYIGMTHWHEAVFCRLGGDPSVLESVRSSYRLFNHTVAPEPDGRLLGGFNFNHRVGDGFFLEQWSGSKGILDDLLPEVGIWAGPAPSNEALERQRAEAAQAIEAFLAAPKPPRYADIDTSRYLYQAEPDRSGVWPAQEQGSFIRVFADQLVAVKRPAYYTNLWIGKPAAGEFYLANKESLRLPFAGGIEDNGGELPNLRKVTPFLGGGLTGFWTPGYGHSLMAACWTPTTHHGLIATQADGKRYWEDYFAHTNQLDEAAGRLTFRGKVEAQPLRYQRTYQFGDEALAVELQLDAEADCSLAALVENLPFAGGKWKARGAELRAAEVTEGTTRTERLTIVDSTGAGVAVVFDQPRDLRLVPDGLKAGGWRQLQFGRAEVVLPPTLQAGQSVSLRYRLEPLR